MLKRMPFRGELADFVRRVRSAEARKTARILRGDLEASRKQLCGVASGLPLPTPDNSVWMICSMPTVWGLKLEGVMSMAARCSGFDPKAVYADANPWPRKYHRLFGIDSSLRFYDYVERTPLRTVPELGRDAGCFTTEELLALSYRRVDVGRIALSNVLYRRKFTGLNLRAVEATQELNEELRQVARRVHAAERMAAEHRPALAMVLEKGLSPWAEIFGVCVAAGTDVIQYSGSQNLCDFVLRRFRYDNRQHHPFSLAPETWESVKAMPWDSDMEGALMRGFEESYRTGAWFKRKYLQQDKRIADASAVRTMLGLDPSKKTAVIFSHVLWDATFFYGRGLFQDYESWLVETVRAACANPSLNWVIKLHPDLVWKLKYEGFTGELRDMVAMRAAVGQLPEHVTVVPPDTKVSTYSFFAIADYCLTVRGTVGIEMACHGVPVITAGTGRYSGLGFTIDSESPEDYLARLRNLSGFPPMDSQAITLARRYAHALFHLRPWPLRSFEMLHGSIEEVGHPLVQNMVPRVSSAEEFASSSDVVAFGRWLQSGSPDYMHEHALSGTA